MATDKAEKVRLTVLVAKDIRNALRSEASDRDVEMGDIVTEWVEQNLPEALVRVRRSQEGKKKGGKS